MKGERTGKHNRLGGSNYGWGHVSIDPPPVVRLEKTIFTYINCPLGGSPPKYMRPTKKSYKNSTTDDPPCVIVYALQMGITFFAAFCRSPMKNIFGYLTRIAKTCCDLVLVDSFA